MLSASPVIPDFTDTPLWAAFKLILAALVSLCTQVAVKYFESLIKRRNLQKSQSNERNTEDSSR